MYLERGWYQLDDNSDPTTRVEFIALSDQVPSGWSNGTNGERWVDVNAVGQSIYLSAPGLVNGENHEFALGKTDVSAVPEPGTIALLSMGLLGLGVMSRRRLRKS